MLETGESCWISNNLPGPNTKPLHALQIEMHLKKNL